MVIIIIFFIVTLSLVIYMPIRNNKVYDFRQKVNNLCHDWAMKNIDKLVSGEETSAYEWFWGEMPSYNAMMYSIKPLNYENWFTEESLNKMFNN